MRHRPNPTRLLSVGSIIADIRIDVPALPPRGGDVLGSPATVSAGGGFNILAAAARNGLKAAFGGQHGTGPHGERIRADLVAEGIAALMPPSREGDSGFCVVLVEPDGERTFITSPGVEARPGAAGLRSLPPGPADAVFVSGYDLCYPELGPAIAAWIATLPATATLVLDPGPLVADIPPSVSDAVLARVDVLTLNRREAGLLAGSDDLREAAGRIARRLPAAALLIVRDGAAGCLLVGGDMPPAGLSVPAPAVRMVDSTGAGDAHTGVFVASLAAGLDPPQAARRANAAAALAVTRRGPATAPGTAELEAFIAA
ncbi:PfkB family carbohydrate kinase [Labrys monachus]|uniref:Sugar/nucleoside kinase (Ribokinase family) n=1 Tax=Labrys monachus TaxID=217067 RepID=A0ABU0FBP0_9HYPH|nr:PfkB family carbohydrate kinase [Labrys monachus]MDQ0392034.1 sugar/nucleoside kinase (ribokinase family) [Labrys monachus]